MNYRHAFHAGNPGDVFKHVLLLRLLRALQRKDKGFLYLDTHAGRGWYDLAAPPAPGRADREAEWPAGIGRLWGKAPRVGALADYLALVQEFNRRRGARGGRLRFYPGSPWLAALVRRPQDRLAFWERQPEEARVLQDEFGRRRRMTVVCGDGYDAPRAVLPPLERRALVLMDPPFEEQGEFAAVAGALREGLERFATGVFAVWYPVTERAGVAGFRAAVRALAPPAAFWAELTLSAQTQVRLKGCGMLVINPPWQFAEETPPLLGALAASLGLGPAAATGGGWLVPKA